MTWAVLSPAIIVAASFVFIALERAFPYDRGQPLFRRGWFVDFFWYTLIQSYFLGLVIAGIIAFIDARTGLSRLQIVTHWPLAAQVAFFVVTHDLYIYTFHRMQHRFPLLWRTHEAHHSVKDVDWLAGSRSHAVEILINQTVEYAPIILLGAPPEVALIKGTIDAVWGMYIHSNIDVRSGALQYVLNGPEMHRWHHSSEYLGYGMNFGTKLAVWDWMFGTAHLPAHKPPGYGLADVDFPEEPYAELRDAWRRRRDQPIGAARGAKLFARDTLWRQARLFVAQQAFAFRSSRKGA